MRSIRIRLIALFIFIVTSVLTISGSYAQQKLRETLEQRYHQLHQGVLTRLQISLPSALWNLDHPKVASLLEAELQAPEVLAIRVFDSPTSEFSSRMRGKNGAIVPFTQAETPSGTPTRINLSFQSNDPDSPRLPYPVGEAVIYFDGSLVQSNLNAEIARRIVEVVLVDLVLIVSLSISLQMVFSPLKRLRDGLWELATLDPEKIMDLPANEGNELSEVARAFNRIQAKFKRTISDMREAQEAARAASEQSRLAYEDLKRAQDSLVEAERLASLGGLVAGVAHEINTPVGITLTSASVLASSTQDMRRAMEERGLKKSEVISYFDTADESTRLIMANASRAAQLIQSFKQIAVDQTSEARRKFNLRNYLDEVVLSLTPRIKRTLVSVNIECPADVELDAYPGAFAQIITNLMMNAIVHAFHESTNGHIDIKVQLEGDNCMIDFADDGAGISSEHIERIFDPFFTTRRGTGGSGLGLHIVYNLMVQRFGGTISVKSKLGQGTHFALRFPLVAPLKEAA